jgi:hypothetical protein
LTYALQTQRYIIKPLLHDGGSLMKGWNAIVDGMGMVGRLLVVDGHTCTW